MEKMEKQIQERLLNQILKAKGNTQTIEIRKYEEFMRACVTRLDAESRAIATAKLK